MAAVPRTAASPFIAFPSRRSVVHSSRGIVACTNPLAAQAGLGILRNGGNAADAAVAAAAVLNVVDPSMTGIGGDVFCLFYDARTSRVRSLNGSGRSPANATLEAVSKVLGAADPKKAIIPRSSIHAVTVPGAAAAWVDTLEHFGSGETTLKNVLSPAIELAENGFPVSQFSAEMWALTENDLKAADNGFELLKQDPGVPDGFRAPKEGEIFKCPTLASTLRKLASHGKAGFYEGSIAEAIVHATQQRGGFLTLEDLKYHSQVGSEIGEAMPLKLGDMGDASKTGACSINGLTLWEHPPNGQGIVALITLGIIQHLERAGTIPKLGQLAHNSVKYLHIIIETLRIAFADASWFVSDPDDPAVRSPEKLLTPEYLAARAKLFNPERASYVVEHGSPSQYPSDTVYLSVTDSEGNGCSFVNSLSERFGSCIIPKGTGVALQNRGSAFRLDPEHPNVLAPRKRPFNTIIPAIVTNTHDGSLKTVYGVMGGFMQPQGHVQVLLNMQLFCFDSQVALDAPRICVGAPAPGKALDPSKEVDLTVYLEEGISEDVARELEAMGHEVKMVSGTARALFGRGQVIDLNHDPVTKQRVYSAGSDARGDGAAAPL